ncbi:MAG: diguanylate cyclase [Dehalococcoidia bacterium]
MEYPGASADLNLDGVARSVVRAVSRLLRVPLVALVRREETGAFAEVVASATSPPIDPSTARDLLGAPRGSGAVIRIADVHTEHGTVAGAMRAHNLRSLLLVPVQVDAGETGLILAGAPEPHAFTESQEEIAVTIAEQAAALFACVRQLELERADRRRAQALLEVARAITQSSDLEQVLPEICRAAASFSVAHRCATFLTDVSGRPRPVTGWDRFDGPQDERREHFISFQTDLLQNERAATSAEVAEFMAQLPLVLDDVSKGPRLVQPWAEEFGFRSVAIYPLTTRQGIVGIMILSAHDRQVHFPVGEVETMSAIALQAAAVIEHMYLLEQVRRQAERDSLTGLYNRRFVLEMLEDRLQEAEQTHAPLAVALLDIDGMKRLNDTQGHAAGDALLQHVAAALTHSFRESDTIARYGGDEFLVLIPGAPVHVVVERCTRLLAVIAEAEPAVGASIGVALFPADGIDAKVLLDAADRAMYAAKRGGAGGVALAHDQSP